MLEYFITLMAIIQVNNYWIYMYSENGNGTFYYYCESESDIIKLRAIRK